jgi:hypothetical protein
MVAWDIALIFGMPLVAFSFLPVNIALLTEDSAGTPSLGLLVPIGIWLLGLTCYLIWMMYGATARRRNGLSA